jgi:hypothetical protein
MTLTRSKMVQCFLRAVGLIGPWKLWNMRNDEDWLAVWAAAKFAVDAAIIHRGEFASQAESQVSYCPGCGQVPNGDRRFYNSTNIALSILPKSARRSDLDFALAYYYWKRMVDLEREDSKN